MRLAVAGDDLKGDEALLDLPFGPEHGFDEFIGRKALADAGQVRPDGAAVLADLMAGDAGELGIHEDAGAATDVAARLGFFEKLRDQLRAVFEGLRLLSRRHGGEAHQRHHEE
jgi:hypothetical protein